MKKITLFICGGLIGGLTQMYVDRKKRQKNIEVHKKMEIFYNLLDQWRCVEELGVTLEELLLQRGYKKIAIYGLGKIGKHVYQDLKNGKVDICYGIDKGINGKYQDIEIRNPLDDLNDVDAIVVTAVLEYKSIKLELERKTSLPIISLEEILFESN